MGYLVIDHRGTCDATGTRDGVLEEYDTKPCCHCQGVLLVKYRAGHRYVDTPHRCDRCAAPLCPECARIMDVTKSCPGPVLRQIERAERRRRSGESFDFYFSRSKESHQ